jgi:hypothetical protein
MTDYLSLWLKPGFLTLCLGFCRLILFMKLFTLADKMLFFSLIVHKSFEMACVLSLKSSYNRNSPKLEPIICERKISSYILKVMKSQNEYMKSSHCPKYEQKIREISTLEDCID